MEQHGISLPLAPQATTDESTRFETGLNKQIELFGADIVPLQLLLIKNHAKVTSIFDNYCSVTINGITSSVFYA